MLLERSEEGREPVTGTRVEAGCPAEAAQCHFSGFQTHVDSGYRASGWRLKQTRISV